MTESFEQTTIRTSLLSAVVDHLMKGKITCSQTHQVGCELVALLSAYREEDHRLFPEVYLMAGSDDLLPVLAPGTQRLSIGQTALDEDAEAGARKTARKVLKDCAGLAIDGWSVFIRRSAAGFDYGLFRPSAASYSVGAEIVLVSSSLAAVILRNCAENTVEIVNSVGARLEISLTTATPSKRAMGGEVAKFAAAACSEVVEASRGLAASYISKVLIDCLRASHGALLAVAPSGRKLKEDRFDGGVILGEPIPLAQTMISAISENTATAASLLRSQESLLRGMIGSDGVTILGTDGSIKAFRVFVRPAKSTPAQKVGGGARSRAFEVLRSWVESKALVAAMIRSQDGRTEVVVSS